MRRRWFVFCFLLLAGHAAAQDGSSAVAFGSVVGPGDDDLGEPLLDPSYAGVCTEWHEGTGWQAVLSVDGVPGGGELDRWLTGPDAGASVGDTSGGAAGGPCDGGVFPGFFDEDADGVRDGAEPLYLDRDGDGRASAGDVRLVSDASPGTEVAAGDADAGTLLQYVRLEGMLYDRTGDGASADDLLYLASGATVHVGAVRLWSESPASPPVTPAGTERLPPAAAWTGFGSAVALVAAVPLLDRLAPRAGSAALVASWLLHGVVLFTASAASAVSLAVLLWNGVAYASYRLRRRNPRGVPGLAGSVGLLAVVEVHADVADHTWRRDFWLRATSDHDGDRVALRAEAQLGAYHAFFYRRHRVEVTPTLRRLPGTPPRVEVVGTGAGASGPLALVVRPEVAQGDGVVEASVEARAEFVGKPWRVLFSRWGLEAEGEVGGDRVHHSVGLGTYRWTDGAG